MNKLVFGIGYNDANYKITSYIKGKQIMCPFYRRWKNMLKRCYNEVNTAYKDVTVCKEWHSFMNFKRWMEAQDWEGKELDKDLLASGNKVYSPDTCIFISQAINTLLIKSDSIRGLYPMWVSIHTQNNNYQSSIKHKSKLIYLGVFDTILKAHQSGQRKKIEIIREAAELEESIIKNALLRIADKIQGDLDNNLETNEY